VTFRYAEYYAAAIIYYLVIVSILMILQSYFERKFRWTTKAAKVIRTRPEKEEVIL
jgi:hypothetical protein